jgi:hypothetical protein
MTHAAAGRPNNRATFLAHYPLQVAVVLIALDVGARFPMTLSAVPWVLAAVVFALFVAFLYSQFRHQQAGLCEQCAKDTPLDPQKAVNQRMRWLKLTHKLFDTKWRRVVGLLPLGIALAGWVTIGWFHLGWITAPLFWAAMLGPAVLVRIHNPLQPWCPFCHWDDGGDEEPSPEPTPDPSIAPDRVDS